MLKTNTSEDTFFVQFEVNLIEVSCEKYFLV